MIIQIIKLIFFKIPTSRLPYDGYDELPLLQQEMINL